MKKKYTLTQQTDICSPNSQQFTQHQKRINLKEGAVGVPLYIFNISSHQPLLLQKVDGGGGSFFQDGNVRAFIHPEVQLRLRVCSFRSEQRQQHRERSFTFKTTTSLKQWMISSLKEVLVLTTQYFKDTTISTVIVCCMSRSLLHL